MNKQEIIELVVTRFPQVHERVAEAWITLAFNQILYEDSRKDPSNFDFYSKTYKNVAILKDPDTDIYYSTLPQQVVQLPDNAEGVRRINAMKGLMPEFIPLQRDSWDVFAGLDAGKIDHSIGFSPTNERIEYERNPEISKVRMDLVIPFDKYDDDDFINIPSGSDLRIIAIVEQLINGTPPESKLNN